MDDVFTGLPPGWQYSKSSPKGDCIVHKHLEDFKYVEVRYEADEFGHDYSLYLVDCEGPGPYQATHKGRFDDLSKAIQGGNRL